ncbi:hypothetical protein MLD38_026377 [Melastoma candidum]|uniref:Uncharacterized protein n=1 Tax=Melastoma candidum TaxID=119954 RepID=A0ACB9NY63_9MYRT|nr:hypothetical protein MLD38_026377 [Melastoma candidum]
MASGWGITGNKGRCYDFWMDFSECMSRCRSPRTAPSSARTTSSASITPRSFKEGTRVYKEEQRKLRAAAQKADGGGGTESHH